MKGLISALYYYYYYYYYYRHDVTKLTLITVLSYLSCIDRATRERRFIFGLYYDNVVCQVQTKYYLLFSFVFA